MVQQIYGDISHSDGFWVVNGEPFVRARLKRVFAQLPGEAGATLKLKATPENSRELLWFTERYPMTIQAEDRALIERLAARHVAAEQSLAELQAGIVAPANVELAKPAREYQIFAAQMALLRRGLLLGDDLGLGKSVSAIATAVLGGTFPAVFVCPAHLTRQWRDVFKEFAPSLNVHIIKSGKLYDLTPKRRGRKAQEQLSLIPESTLPDVLIVSYHMLRGWAEFLMPLVKLAVFDECQQLRHPTTEIYRSAKTLANGAEIRLGLSATPILNYGAEFFHVLSVLQPDALGTYHEFLNGWCSSRGVNAVIKDPKAFGGYLRRSGLMLRRTRRDVGRELPKLTKVIHEIQADPTALETIKGNAIALARAVLQHNEQYRGQRMHAAGEFDNLIRQATGIAKAPYVVEFTKLLLESGEKIVLFGWHRACYDIWLRGLAAYKPVMYTGSESPSQKEAALKAFIEGDSQVLLMSLRSGAGADGLQKVCRTVVIGELDWSPGVIEQCIGRVDRDGQEWPCTAYYLVGDSGADPIMTEVLGLKREQIEGVRNPDEQVLIERADIGENHLRRLAREFLAKHGMAIEAEAPLEAIAA